MQMNIGSQAPIGAQAKLGAKAWGAEGSAPSGEVLFDGTVTITGSDPVPIVLESPLVVGKTLTITLNGVTASDIVEELEEGVIGMDVTVGEATLTVATMGGDSFFFASGPPAVIGENTLKLVQS